MRCWRSGARSCATASICKRPNWRGTNGATTRRAFGVKGCASKKLARRFAKSTACCEVCRFDSWVRARRLTQQHFDAEPQRGGLGAGVAQARRPSSLARRPARPGRGAASRRSVPSNDANCFRTTGGTGGRPALHVWLLSASWCGPRPANGSRDHRCTVRVVTRCGRGACWSAASPVRAGGI